MQTESVIRSEIAPRKTLREQLTNLRPGTNECLVVSAAKVGTLYTTCSNLKKEEGMSFKTQKDGDKVNVWRLA